MTTQQPVPIQTGYGVVKQLSMSSTEDSVEHKILKSVTNITNTPKTMKTNNSSFGRNVTNLDSSPCSVDLGIIVEPEKDLMKTAIRKIETLKNDIKYSQLALKLARLIIEAEEILNTADYTERLHMVRCEFINLLKEVGVLNGDTAILFDEAVSLPFHPTALAKLVPYLQELYLLNLSEDPSEKLNLIIKTVRGGILCTKEPFYDSYPTLLQHYYRIRNSCRNDIMERFVVTMVSLESYMGDLCTEDKKIIFDLVEISKIPFIEYIFELEMGPIMGHVLRDVKSCITIMRKYFNEFFVGGVLDSCLNRVTLEDAEKYVQHFRENYLFNDYELSDDNESSDDYELSDDYDDL